MLDLDNKNNFNEDEEDNDLEDKVDILKTCHKKKRRMHGFVF
ncbi:MAG: hypothetical protein AABY84_13080 [Candidatus Firestonebacteria bacterium]